MSRDSFIDVGNLAEAPVLRFVNVGTEKRSVADMRVYCAKYFRDATGELKERPDSFWINVSLWGSKAERAAKLLTKGARVCVIGELGQQKWVNQETGEQKSQFTVTASDVFLDLSRVSNINWTESRSQHKGSGASDVPPDMEMPPIGAYDDAANNNGQPVEANNAVSEPTMTEPTTPIAGKRTKGMKEASSGA